MENPKQVRRSFSPSQQRSLVAEWEQSDQSAYAFGKRHGVGAGSLIRWKAKHAAADAKLSFLPVRFAEDERPGSKGHVVAQVVVGAVQLQIFAGVQQRDLRELLGAIQAVQR